MLFEKKWFLFGFYFVLIFNTAFAYYAMRSLAEKQPENNSTTNKRPEPPKRIPPNRVKPGGGLNPYKQSCTHKDKSLVALVPVDNPVATTKAHPSFLFYLPDEAKAIAYGEFTILTADEKTRIYETKILIPETATPGIIKIELPPSLQTTLQQETYYHWYFRVYCQNLVDANHSLDVDGWIKRVPLTPAKKSKLETTSPDLWYDVITEAADNIMVSPQNVTNRDRWIQLLEHINMEHLADYPIFNLN